MSETFHVETDNSTCNAGFEFRLYTVEQFWQYHVFSDFFNFRGPCEQGTDGIVLEYDDGSGPVEWEMEEIDSPYDQCWLNGPNHWVCMNDGWDNINWENDCDEGTDGWLCHNWNTPRIEEAADLDMTWTLEDLEVGDNYTVWWNYCTYEIMGDKECSDEDQEWPDIANITATSGEHSVDWELVIENATCNVDIEWGVVYWGDEAIDFEEGEPFNEEEGEMEFQGPCQWEWPIDVSLEVDDNGWQEIEGIYFMEIMDMEEDSEDGPNDDGGDDGFMELIMDNHYQLSEGNWSMLWTLDGLEEDGTYMLEWQYEGPESDRSFFCGNGEEIPFDWVNDEEQDCEDGADEQQYDDDGDPINWFDCNDGSEVWVYQVNDGNDDCPDGEDEGGSGGDGDGEIFEATSSSETFEWELEVPSDMCIMMISAGVFDEDNDQVGWFMAFIAGELWADDDGDNWPDCLPRDDDDFEGGWSIEDFARGQDYTAELVEVDSSNGTATVFVAQHTTLDDDFRMKVDYDFFDGDGMLNETEAESFNQAQGDAWPEGCMEGPGNFTMNGIAYWCAVGFQTIENLANNSNGVSPVWIAAWHLHFNASVDDSGQMTLYFPGGDDEDDPLDFNGTLCGGSAPGTGLVPVSWSYNNASVTSLCVDVMAGDHIGTIEILFGSPDTDGDGYNDFDDRFPEDPSEWADSDDDGYGDNSDEFPTDPDEYTDSDGDGVGDNGDAFPWDPTESADSDGDGWGDNSDAFPNDSTEWVDTDGDGTGDNADTDADGDGTSDSDEDSDGDGVNDDEDDFPRRERDERLRRGRRGRQRGRLPR
jgi:hypothetical protein